jgi:hypothetical protein
MWGIAAPGSSRHYVWGGKARFYGAETVDGISHKKVCLPRFARNDGLLFLKDTKDTDNEGHFVSFVAVSWR